MPPKIIHVSPTSLDSIELCLRKAYYSKIRRLYPREPVLNKSDALDRGSLIHELLADYYTIRKDNGNKKIDGSLIIDLIEKCRAKCLIDSLLPSETIERTINVFTQYILHYGHDTSWEILAIEAPFSKEAYADKDIRIIVEGKIDLIVRDSRPSIVPVDHKSKDRDAYPVSLRNQFVCYAWALESDMMIENVIGMQKTIAPSEKFVRHPHSYTPSMISDWLESLVYHVKRMHQASEIGYFPASLSHCWTCRYSKICSTDIKDREAVIKRDWAPGEGSDLYEEEEAS